ALRCVGRIDFSREIEFVPHCGEIEVSVVPVPGETTIVNAVQVSVRSRVRGLVVAGVALLMAFGLFCRFYSWKLPAASDEGTKSWTMRSGSFQTKIISEENHGSRGRASL